MKNTSPITTPRAPFLISALLLLAFATPARPDSLSQSLLSSFPKNISELSYSDFSKTRSFPWFAQFKRQTLPTGFTQLEQFLSSVGIDPNRQIEQLVWSLSAPDAPPEPDPDDNASSTPKNSIPPTSSPQYVPADPAALASPANLPARTLNLTPPFHHDPPDSDQLLAIALGNFDPDAAESLLEKSKAATISWRGYTLYSCGSGCHNFFLVFLDSETVAFGNPRLLQHLLDVRAGAEDSILSNKTLFPLIHKVNGDGIFWSVLNDAATRGAILQLLPNAAKFPDVTKLLAPLHAMTITIDGDDHLDAQFNISAAPENAAPLAQLLQAALLFRQFQASQQDPDLAKILQEVSIAPAGPGIQITFSITTAQIVTLIQHNLLSPNL